MDDNQFLNAYKKKMSEQEQAEQSAAPQAEQPEAERHPEQKALRYEEKSDFVPSQPVTGRPPRSMPRRSRWLPAAVVSGIILVLAVFLVWLFGRGVEVVNLANWTLNDAQLWASDKGIRLQVTEVHDDDFAEGRIISQDPKPGSMLEKGGFLKLTVSLGHDLSVTLPLPDLLNMTLSEVEDWAESNYMTRVRITTEYHDAVAAGRVIRFEVNDDTVVNQVRRNSPVYVIVSRGPNPQGADKVVLPNFKEMTVLQSRQFAAENGLVLEIVEQYNDLFPAGSIVDQSTAPDEEVPAGTEITLVVSLGKKILVPDFSTYTRERAAAVAAELGISLTFNERYSSRTAGRFIEQNLEAGSIYITGDILELTYSLGNEIILPSFVGSTRTSIESWAVDLNVKGASIRISVTQTQNNAPRDTIIYQDKTNTLVAPGTTVRITVSLGKRVFMPDLVAPSGSDYGQAITRDIALNQLESLGLIPIFVAEQKSGRLPGEIWHQSVAPGTEVYEGTTVTLKYNPVNVTLTLPDFRGMTETEIAAAGYLKKLNITFASSDVPIAGYAGQVYDQTLPAGRTVAAGTAITLWVSPEEPAVSPDPEPTAAATPAETAR